MPSKTIESMKLNRRIRKRRHPQYRSTTAAVIAIIVTLFVGGILVRVIITWLYPFSSTDSSNRPLDVPLDDIDLWLQSTNLKMNLDPIVDTALRQQMEVSCLPYDSDKNTIFPPDLCQMRKDGDTDRIGVLRPPGLLGNVFEDYMVRFIEQSRTEDTDMVVIVQSHLYDPLNEEKLPRFTKILRPFVMPILLEAIDLTLHTTGDDFSQLDVVLEDLTGVLRLLVRWHCRLAQIASNTALLSVSFHRLMTHPQDVDRDIVEFLDLQYVKGEKLHAHMDTYAETVFQRIDTSTSFLNELRSRTRSTSFVDAILSVVREETYGEYCVVRKPSRGSLLLPITRNIPISRVIDLIGSFLDGSFATACERYPKAQMCRATKNDKNRKH